MDLLQALFNVMFYASNRTKIYKSNYKNLHQLADRASLALEK